MNLKNSCLLYFIFLTTLFFASNPFYGVWTTPIGNGLVSITIKQDSIQTKILAEPKINYGMLPVVISSIAFPSGKIEQLKKYEGYTLLVYSYIGDNYSVTPSIKSSYYSCVKLKLTNEGNLLIAPGIVNSRKRVCTSIEDAIKGSEEYENISISRYTAVEYFSKKNVENFSNKKSIKEISLDEYVKLILEINHFSTVSTYKDLGIDSLLYSDNMKVNENIQILVMYATGIQIEQPFLPFFIYKLGYNPKFLKDDWEYVQKQFANNVEVERKVQDRIKQK